MKLSGTMVALITAIFSILTVTGPRIVESLSTPDPKINLLHYRMADNSANRVVAAISNTGGSDAYLRRICVEFHSEECQFSWVIYPEAATLLPVDAIQVVALNSPLPIEYPGGVAQVHTHDCVVTVHYSDLEQEAQVSSSKPTCVAPDQRLENYLRSCDLKLLNDLQMLVETCA